MTVGRSSGRRSIAFTTALMVLLALALPFSGIATASHGGTNNATADVTQVTLSPDSATIPSGGTCVAFTATATSGGAVAEGETVDIIAAIGDDDGTVGATGEISDLTIAFCDPDGAGTASDLSGASPDPATGVQTPGGGAAATDSDDDGAVESAATIQEECLTNSNGQCTFGISVTDANASATTNSGGSGTVTVFGDQDGDNVLDAGEPRDISTITVGQSGNQAVASIVCTPETQSRADGGRAEFNCTATNSAGQGLSGIQLTVDVTAGPNAEEINGANCGSPTGATGATTTSPSTFNGQPPGTAGACGYNDTVGATSLPGTDTVAICVQQTPSPGQAATAGCDAFEVQDTVTVNWVGAASKITCTPDGLQATPGSTVAGQCQATDVNNLPSGAGVAIIITEAGPGTVTLTGPSATAVCTGGAPAGSVCAVTNSSGVVTFQSSTATNETGLQTITGTLGSTAQGTAGGTTNCGAVTQGTPNTGAPTGTDCTDDATINWTTPTQPPPPTDCADGSDNDGDGEIDLNDQGCRDASDPTEAGPFDSAVTLRRSGRRFWVGQVASSFGRCQRGRVVTLFRNGSSLGSDTTDSDGNWRKRVRNNRRPGRYQARVAARTITTASGDQILCRADRSPVVRVRRR